MIGAPSEHLAMPETVITVNSCGGGRQCSWDPAGRGQRCRSAFYRAQDRAHNTKSHPAPNPSSVETEELGSRGFVVVMVK